MKEYELTCQIISNDTGEIIAERKREYSLEYDAKEYARNFSDSYFRGIHKHSNISLFIHVDFHERPFDPTQLTIF